MIQIKLQKKLKNFQLDLDFQTDKTRIGILGPSGSGKSMTLKMISGIESPDHGEIKIGGKTLYSSKEKINLPPQGRDLGFLFQDYGIFPHLTVRGNLEILNPPQEAIAKLLHQFGLQSIENQPADRISGGQKQRLALARIMTRKNRALLLDEPFSALDYALKEQIKFELMTELNHLRLPYIMVSHSNVELYEFTDELIVLDRGRMILQGPTEAIFHRPEKLKVAKLLGVENLIPADSNLGQKIPLKEDYFGIYERDIKLGPGQIQWEVEIKERIRNPFSFDYLTVCGLRFKSAEELIPGDRVLINVAKDKIHPLTDD